MIDRRRGSRSLGLTVGARWGPPGSRGVPGPRGWAGPALRCEDQFGAAHVRSLPRSGDRGSASVLVALWAVVLTVLASGAMVLTSVLAARAAVAAAADLAALAGASATLDDPGDACTRARTIGRANGVTLTECRVGGTEVWVVARAPAPAAVEWLLPGRGHQLGARAHAELRAQDP